MKDMEGQIGNFPNTCLLAFKELLIKDWKTTYLHLPEKIMSYASERSLYIWNLLAATIVSWKMSLLQDHMEIDYCCSCD